MPYIPKDRREEIDAGDIPIKVSDLTYIIYKAMVDWVRQEDPADWEERAKAILACESAKLEFYRRHVAGYEDGAILRNGDV